MLLDKSKLTTTLVEPVINTQIVVKLNKCANSIQNNQS